MDDDPTAQEMFEHLLPYMVHNLLKKGKFNGVDQESSSELLKVLSNNIAECVDDVEFPIAVSENFIDWAQKAHNEGDKFVAITLVAIAMEQAINQCYRFVLQDTDLLDDEITKVIKNNIDSKLSWLLKLIAKSELDSNLRKNIKSV